ncbi:MAG: hypothetical protein RLZZ198_1952 [Bacteroidota bacterium]|jgi:uncharacterized protein (DUF1501 family)
MKRRQFIKNVALSSASLPFVSNGFGMQALSQKLFNFSTGAEDRVLVMIRLNGGNDGLNTVIPLDQYANLMIHRSEIIIPQNQILSVTPEVGFHPQMQGMKGLFDQGKLSVVQNVGYPEQNRSHFRSMDIWTSGSLDVSETRGWLGRYFDSYNPNYPTGYPNVTYPDPFAISMGSEVTATCQGIAANFSHAVSNPNNAVNLYQGGFVNDGSYYGEHVEFVGTIIEQTNSFGQVINAAAQAGNNLSGMYDPTNTLATQLKYVAQMISGGLKTKVYVVSLGGFDTHDNQADATNLQAGAHRGLLKTVSDAIAAFQDDLQLLGLEQRVVGMTFSEFGRQIESNASLGTDHGDAAPLFLFGTCIQSGIIGPNPTIASSLPDQAGIAMQIDFRDVYASILRDWFQVPTNEVQQLFAHQVQFYSLAGTCNVSLEEQALANGSMLIYPNPTPSNVHVKVNLEEGRTMGELRDANGATVKTYFDQNFSSGVHTIFCDMDGLASGTYFLVIRNNEKTLLEKVVKMK